MSSPARTFRRRQAQQIAKQLSKAQRQPPPVPEPSPADRAADRLGVMGVAHARSLLWTPKGS